MLNEESSIQQQLELAFRYKDIELYVFGNLGITTQGGKFHAVAVVAGRGTKVVMFATGETENEHR